MFLLVALPWIITLSVKYDKPTFLNLRRDRPRDRRPGNERPAPHPFGSTVYQPDTGRVTAWEDPSRMNYDYWSPFGSGENFSHQLSLIGRNTLTEIQFLAAFDGVGKLFGWFGLGTLVFILALVAKPPRAKNWLTERWRWSVIPLVCLGGVYLPVYVMPVDLRYFYLFLPLFFILSLGQAGKSLAKREIIACTCALLFLVALALRTPVQPDAGIYAQDLAQRMKKARRWGRSSARRFFQLKAIGSDCSRLAPRPTLVWRCAEAGNLWRTNDQAPSTRSPFRGRLWRKSWRPTRHSGM